MKLKGREMNEYEAEAAVPTGPLDARHVVREHEAVLSGGRLRAVREKAPELPAFALPLPQRGQREVARGGRGPGSVRGRARPGGREHQVHVRVMHRSATGSRTLTASSATRGESMCPGRGSIPGPGPGLNRGFAEAPAHRRARESGQNVVLLPLERAFFDARGVRDVLFASKYVSRR